MQETFQIDAVSRSEEGKGASRRLRRSGMVPGIVYGGDKEPEMIATKQNELGQHLEHEAFYSHVLRVKIGDVAQKVVLKDLQRHPSKPFILHFDLMRVADTDRIKMHVPLHFIGEEKSVGVKQQGGNVSHHMSDIEIVCEAQSLPEFIEVDVSAMEVGDVLHLSQLNLPEGVEILLLQQGEDHDYVVVTMHGPKGDEIEGDEEGGEGVEGEA